jgi:hypothetical protein
MHKTKILLYTISVILILHGCKSLQEKYYSYKVNRYAIDSVKHLLSPSHIISYGNYLFEFRIKVNVKNEIFMKSGTVASSINYDTLSVYLLDDKNGLYYIRLH